MPPAGALPVLLTLALACSFACGDRDRPAGQIEGGRRHPKVDHATDDIAAGVRNGAKQILFGDLHVHTTYSIDAFVSSLALFGGEGAHPPADACDYARHCAALDFFSINDHAEGLTPELWARTKSIIRQCNALAGEPPDLVAFVGWEWTQVGSTPETHFGHRNVIFPGLSEDDLPTRPIDALPADITERAAPPWLLRALQGVGAVGLDDYADFLGWIERMARMNACPPAEDPRSLPPTCRESAATPAELFAKLEQWGFPSLVIPHGLAWGIHAPPGSRMDNQLAGGQHDPGRQRLIEVFSGHGNGEEYRSFAEFVVDARGERSCPKPTPDYLPCCWRAGEIMRNRCGDLPLSECEARVEEAQRLALEAGPSPERVFPDTRAEDWLDCDQCRDCFKPAMTLRPRETAQYAAAISSFESPTDDDPLRFRFGFIASSDNHSGRAATGFKQLDRRRTTDASGFASERAERWLRPWVEGRQRDPRRAQPAPKRERGLRDLFDTERLASFMYTGGAVAVHADARSREAIWEALARREVYGTSGPRILLSFDLLNGPDGSTPMGSAVDMDETPRFEVRTAGAFEQLPGCPEATRGVLSADRLARLCGGECYHPSDTRHPIAAIEIVRIRPQRTPDEPVAGLIEDPWLRYECDPDSAGCVAQFEDTEFTKDARDSAYYARAVQAATPAINAANVRASIDAEGRVVSASPCLGSYRTEARDDCLAPEQERAWSSPIYVDWIGVRPRDETGGT